MNSKLVRAIGAVGALFNLVGVQAYLAHVGAGGRLPDFPGGGRRSSRSSTPSIAGLRTTGSDFTTLTFIPRSRHNPKIVG